MRIMNVCTLIDTYFYDSIKTKLTQVFNIKLYNTVYRLVLQERETPIHNKS